MSDETSASSANCVLLTRLADEFAARYRAGERPSLQEYIDRHPALAEDIRELFPAMVEIEQAKDDRQEAAEQAAPAVPALRQLGDFRILREVGRGGMGVVYEAEQVTLGRHVALKLLPRNLLLDAQAKRRFEREARSAARLHHTNIVPVFGVGEQDGMPYYVMQFIQGLGLDDVLEELKKLQVSGATAGTSINGEPRASSHEGQVFDVPAEGGGRKTRTQGAVSAVNVARSLLTGEFQSTVDEDDEATTPVTVEDACKEDQGQPTPRSPGLSDSFTPSSSSVVLPGQSRDGSKTRYGKKRTYWQSVASIGAQVAGAMEYAHKQGIHHRDIKPSNLLLDTQGTVWVTDFGLAKADDQQNLTHTGDILGTLRYMPPEAFEGKTDARGDVYSLGLTLYEMLAFRAAFDEKERNRLIKQVTEAEPDPLGKLNRQVPQDLQTIVHKAIDKDPARRYATAGALAEDLQRFIDDEPIKARRVSPAERLWRWCRRNPMAAALSAAVAWLLIGVAVVSTAFAVHVAAARDSAIRAQEDEVEHRRHAEKNLYRSLVGEAEALRRARGDGYRAEVWQRLQQALRLETPARDLAQLRQEAVACMGDFVGLGATVWSDFPAEISRVALHPDGRQVAVALWDGEVLFRRLPGGEEITRLPRQSQPIADLIFGHSGEILVTRGVNGSIAVWRRNGNDNWASTRIIEAKMGGGRGSLVLTPNGKVAAAIDKGDISLWDLSDGSRAATLAGPKGEPLHCLTVSPDGTWLAAAYQNQGTHGVLVWDLASRKLRHILLPRLDGVCALAFSPNGKFLACACKFGVAVHDTEEFRRTLTIPGDSSIAIAFSHDNRFLAFPGAVLGQVRLWSLSANREVAVLTSKTEPHTMVFSPDGKQLVAATPRSIGLWNLAGTPERRALEGHAEGIPGTVFSPDGKRLVSVSKDQSLKVWDPATGEMLCKQTGFAGHLQAVAFSADGRMLATGDEGGGVRLWHAETLQELAAPSHDLGKQIWAVGFSPDTGYFAACGERGLALWRVQNEAADRTDASPLSGKPIVRRVKGHQVEALCFSPDSKLLAWGTLAEPGRRVVQLWDLPNAREYPSPPARIGWFIHGLAFFPDSKLLSVVNQEGTATVWDVSTGRMSFSLNPKHDVGGTFALSIVALSADGRWLAATRGRAVTVWDTQTRQPLLTLPEERSMPWSLAWDPTGDLLAVGTSDGGLVVWSIPEVRAQLVGLGLNW